MTSAEARYRALLAASTAVVWSTDPDGAVVDEAPRWGEFTGQCWAAAAGDAGGGVPSSYRGLGWLEAVHPDDRLLVAAAWQEPYVAGPSAGAASTHSFRLRRRDGAYRLVEARRVPVFGADGLVGEWLGVAADVTDERLAAAGREKLLRRTRLLYEVTAALAGARTAAQVAAVVVGNALPSFGAASGVLATLRGAAGDAGATVEIARAFGLKPGVEEAWRTFPLADPTPIGDAIRTGAPVVLETPEAIAREYPLVAPAIAELGSRALWAVPLAPNPGRPGRVLGALSFSFPAPRALSGGERALLDALTAQCALALDRVRLSEAEHGARAAAEQARQRAEEANRVKSQFLATMSHELRTPLNAILGHVQLIELGIYGPLTADQEAALGRVQRAQRHLLGLINNVLDYARVEAGRVEYALGPVSLRELLADLGPLVEPQLAAKGHAYDVRLPAEAARVVADRDKLRQVLVNLLANAVKFTPPGGLVGVSVAEREDAPGVVFVRVSDTGVGIAEEQLEAVFDPFVQGDAGLTRSHEGTGLGLAISREFARGMGGDLRVRSRVGKGSVFTVSLRKA